MLSRHMPKNKLRIRRWLWVIPLLSAIPLIAKDKELGGYVLDAATFQGIHTYCIDTHTLPPREVKVIGALISRESRPQGLLARLPWRRLPACQPGVPDAIVRMEFPHSHSLSITPDVNGMLFVFKPGSPTPIYETREVLTAGGADGDNSPGTVAFLEDEAAAAAVRILIRDWQKVAASIPSEPSYRGSLTSRVSP